MNTIVMANTSEKSTILVVDDSPEILSLINGMLKNDYLIKLANSGERAIKLASMGQPPDIILLDIQMPDMDGLSTCQQLKELESTANVPVLFLTAMSGEADETRGLELGAVDYVTKPISFPILRARIRNHLELKRTRDMLSYQNRYLEYEVQRRVEENSRLQDITIQAMATLAETRDNETGNHIIRTQNYVRTLAEELREHPRFAHALHDPNNINLLFKSAPLHDIGKVGIPDHILLKPGKLTPEEWVIMKTHPTLGKQAIERAEKNLGVSWPFLSFAKEIAYSHHEKWDGTGYPEGIAGDDIPVSARLMAVADVYDALINRRVYKEAMPHVQAIDIIREGKDTHFDPDIVDAFFRLEDRFLKIAKLFSDN